MQRSPLAVAALVCLLVTAGCFGLFGGRETPDPATSVAPTDSPTASPTPTGTGTPAPTASPTPAALVYPPEVNQIGIDAERIASEHGDALRNTSFTIQYFSRRIENGTVTSRTTGRVRYDGEGVTLYNYTVVNADPGETARVHVETWSNGTTTLQAITTENGTDIEETSPLRSPPTFADQIETYLRSFRTRATGYSRFHGGSVVRVSAEDFDLVNSREQYTVEDQAFRLGFVELNGGRFTADLADDRLNRYRVRLFGRDSDGSVSLTEELVFTGVGTTTVDRPAWVTSGNATRSGYGS